MKKVECSVAEVVLIGARKTAAKQHSLEQVQNRDKLKEKAILQCGYTPYVIKDMGGFNPTFVNEKFGELVNWLSRGPHKAK